MAGLSDPPDRDLGTRRKMNSPDDEIALFAVPMPSPSQTDYLCLCKRLFWNVGSSYFTAFCPLSPDETVSLPMASTVVQLVRASPTTETDNMGKKRAPYDLLTYNAKGNIIGVPYLSIHTDTQPHGNHTNGIPYPDMSSSAWVPALNVPFVGSHERIDKERLEDVVFIIRNKKLPTDTLANGTNWLCSKQGDKFCSSQTREESDVPSGQNIVPTLQSPLPLGKEQQTDNSRQIDLSVIVTSEQKTRPICKSPQTGSGIQTASSPKTKVSAASTSLYRSYKSKWMEQQNVTSQALEMDSNTNSRSSNEHVRAKPTALIVNAETCSQSPDMVLPHISSVFSLVDCSSPEESLPTIINNALSKLMSECTETPIQSDFSNKGTEHRVRQKIHNEPLTKTKRARIQKKCQSPMQYSPTSKDFTSQLTNPPSKAPCQPSTPSHKMVKQDAPVEPKTQGPATPISTIQFPYLMASLQPITRTLNKQNPDVTLPGQRQSFGNPMTTVQSPHSLDHLRRIATPSLQDASLDPKGQFSEAVSSAKHQEVGPHHLKTVNVDSHGKAPGLSMVVGCTAQERFANSIGSDNETIKSQHINQNQERPRKHNCLTVREILKRSRNKPGHVSTQQSQLTSLEWSSPDSLPAVHLAQVTSSCDAPSAKPQSRFQSSGNLPAVEVTHAEMSDKPIFPFQPSSNLPKSLLIHRVCVTSAPTSETSSGNSVIINQNTFVSKQFTLKRVTDKTCPTSKDNLSPQSCLATVVNIAPVTRVEQPETKHTGPSPMSTITITNNLGLDNVQFARQARSTEVVIDGKVPCLKLHKMNPGLLKSDNPSAMIAPVCVDDNRVMPHNTTCLSDGQDDSDLDSQLTASLCDAKIGQVQKGKTRPKDVIATLKLKVPPVSFKNKKRKRSSKKRPKISVKVDEIFGINKGSGCNHDIGSNLRDSNVYFAECQSTNRKTKRARLMDDSSWSFDRNFSKPTHFSDQIQSISNRDSTPLKFSLYKNPTSAPPVEVGGRSHQLSINDKDIDENVTTLANTVVEDNVDKMSESSESDCAFSPKEVNQTDSEWDSSLEDDTSIKAVIVTDTEKMRPRENFQHMSNEEKVRLLQESIRKHEMALSSLKTV